MMMSYDVIQYVNVLYVITVAIMMYLLYSCISSWS